MLLFLFSRIHGCSDQFELILEIYYLSIWLTLLCATFDYYNLFFINCNETMALTLKMLTVWWKYQTDCLTDVERGELRERSANMCWAHHNVRQPSGCFDNDDGNDSTTSVRMNKNQKHNVEYVAEDFSSPAHCYQSSLHVPLKIIRRSMRLCNIQTQNHAHMLCFVQIQSSIYMLRNIFNSTHTRHTA